MTIPLEYRSYQNSFSLKAIPYKLAALLLTAIFASSSLVEAQVEMRVGDPLLSEEVPVAEDGEVEYAPSELPEADNFDIGATLLGGYQIDLYAGSSFIYDSNTTQTPVAQSASLFAFSYGVDVQHGEEDSKGGYYGFNYDGQAFVYEDEADEFGRDPFEHSVGTYIGLNGAVTRIRFDLDYHRTNGNAIEFDRIERETRRAASNDYNFNLSIAAFVTPSFAPKTNIGGGFRFGNDHFDSTNDQDFFIPSFRWRYRYSGKTSIYSNLGYEFRSTDGIGRDDSGNLVYTGGVDYAATSKTSFGLDIYRRVTPSFYLAGEDSALTGANFRISNDLPGQFRLATRLGYEDADYFTTNGAAGTGREDQFFRLSLDLSHPLRLTEKLLGEWSIFYNHNENDSTLTTYGFEQNVVGARVVLVY